MPRRPKNSVDGFLAGFRNNKLVTLAIALGVAIIALGNFTDALTKLRRFFGLHSRPGLNVTTLKFASIEPVTDGTWEVSRLDSKALRDVFTGPDGTSNYRSWIIKALAIEAANLWVPGGKAHSGPESVLGEPVFDVTLRNISDDPAIITAVGFEVLMAGILHPTTGDGPGPYEIPIFKDYQIPFPTFRWDWNETSNWQRHVWDVRKNPQTVSVKCKNPIALSAKGAIRYRLAITDFVEAETPGRMIAANHALIRLVVIAGDAGIAKSDTIYLNTAW